MKGLENRQIPSMEGDEKIRRVLRYRWGVWGMMAMAFMVVFFHRLAPAVVKEDISRAFSLNATAFGSLASMYFYAYMAMQIPVGLLADSLGARATVSWGMLAAGAGSVMFGLAPSPLWLYAGRFLVGIGVSTVFVCIMKVQSRWFRKEEFATVSGLTNIAGNSGGLVAQVPLAIFISMVSWRTGFVVVGALTAVLALLCFLVIRNRPGDMGLPSLEKEEDSPHPGTPSVWKGIRDLFATKGLVPAILFYLLDCAGFNPLLGTWGIPFLANVYGLPVPRAASFGVMLILGAMAGGIFWGWISDRTGSRKRPMVAAAVLHTFLWVLLTMWGGGQPPMEWIRPLFFLLGVTNASYVLAWAVAKELAPGRCTGLAISVFNAFGFLAIALGTSFMGAGIDAFSFLGPRAAYRRAFFIGLGSSALSVLFACFVPETGKRKSSGTGA